MCSRVTEQEETYPMHHLNLYVNAHWLSLVFFFLFFTLVDTMVRSENLVNLVAFASLGKQGKKSPEERRNVILPLR